MIEVAVELRNPVKTFGTFRAVDDVSLRVEKVWEAAFIKTIHQVEGITRP